MLDKDLLAGHSTIGGPDPEISPLSMNPANLIQYMSRKNAHRDKLKAIRQKK